MRSKALMRSVPVGSNFIIDGESNYPPTPHPLVYVRIPEMILRRVQYGVDFQPGSTGTGFITNCIFERVKDEFTPSEQICDYVNPDTLVEYWFPV